MALNDAEAYCNDLIEEGIKEYDEKVEINLINFKKEIYDHIKGLEDKYLDRSK